MVEGRGQAALRGSKLTHEGQIGRLWKWEAEPSQPQPIGKTKVRGVHTI